MEGMSSVWGESVFTEGRGNQCKFGNNPGASPAQFLVVPVELFLVRILNDTQNWLALNFNYEPESEEAADGKSDCTYGLMCLVIKNNLYYNLNVIGNMVSTNATKLNEKNLKKEVDTKGHLERIQLMGQV